ncbi:MAG: hypothetical protein GY906_01625, partial [bacterium]|nr:hypothetical protein [bacterium]
MVEALFFALIAFAALAGFGVLRRVECDVFEAWTAARTVGLVAAVLPGWIWGSYFGNGWLVVVVLASGGLGLLGLRQLQRDRSEWRSMFAGEAVFWLGFVAVLLLRLPNPEILGT